MTIKVNFWTLTTDNGDGSSSIRYFSSEKDAEDYADWDGETTGIYPNPENISHVTLEFDDNGILLTVDKIQ